MQKKSGCEVCWKMDEMPWTVSSKSCTIKSGDFASYSRNFLDRDLGKVARMSELHG